MKSFSFSAHSANSTSLSLELVGSNPSKAYPGWITKVLISSSLATSTLFMRIVKLFSSAAESKLAKFGRKGSLGEGTWSDEIFISFSFILEVSCFERFTLNSKYTSLCESKKFKSSSKFLKAILLTDIFTKEPPQDLLV
ncbi:MAG: hypothetical protein DRP25_06350, partial [Thermotoga sp.]